MTGPTLTPVTHSNKAVAVGAVLFYVDHFVTGRIAKFTFGAPSVTVYQPSDPEYIMREHKSWLDPEGNKRVPDCFETMLSRVCHLPPFIDPPNNFITLQGTKVEEDHEVRSNFSYVTEGSPQLQAFQSIVKYTGAQIAPQWMDIERGDIWFLQQLCEVIEVKQTSSRHCAIYGQISLLLRIRKSGESPARCVTRGILT